MTLWQRITAAAGARRLARLMRFYPPYLGAGIRVTRVDRNLREMEVEMKLRWWNRNYVGTQFGGSLYSMCDPFYMFMLIENLGPEYVVWDKSAAVEFVKPGRGRVWTRFVLTEEQLARIRETVEREGKSHPTFEVRILDDTGETIARVSKTLSVRSKRGLFPTTG